MRISRISRESGADNKFFDYLVLRIYNFELLVGQRIIKISQNHELFDPEIEYFSFFNDQQYCITEN